MLFLLHLLIGTAVSAAIFAVFFRLSPEETTSLPVGPLIWGLICGIGAAMVSPWVTPGALALNVLASYNEYREDRRALESNDG